MAVWMTWSAVIGLLLVGLMAPFAHAQQLVHNAAELSDDAPVKKALKVGKTLAAATVIYSRCTTEFNITPEQQTELLGFYKEAGDAHLQAYQEAYEFRVHYPPEQRIVAQYQKIITDEYQKAANETMAAIRSKKGCKTPGLDKFVLYVEEYKKSKQPKPIEYEDE